MFTQRHPQSENEYLQYFLSKNNCTHSTYFDKTNQCHVHLLLYIDDILLFSIPLTAIKSAKSLLCTRFDISDGGSATYILGVSIEHKQDSISLHQHGFIERTLSKFKDLIPSIQKPIPIHCSTQTTKEVENSNMIPIATAQSIIGTINYNKAWPQFRAKLHIADQTIGETPLLGYLSRTKIATLDIRKLKENKKKS